MQWMSRSRDHWLQAIHLDQFTFKVTNSAGLSTSATLSVVINGADEAPILEGSATTAIAGSPSDLANLTGSLASAMRIYPILIRLAISRLQIRSEAVLTHRL